MATPATPDPERAPPPPTKSGPPSENQRDGNASAPDAIKTPLTPEEQMALFEQELKETDWGHQPC